MKKAVLLMLILAAGAVVLWRNEPKRRQAPSLSGHRVTLRWDASPSHDVSSYRIYISSASGGPYTLVGSVDATEPRIFVDTAVESGRTYYFAITAVESDGKESRYSAQQRVSIP